MGLRLYNQPSSFFDDFFTDYRGSKPNLVNRSFKEAALTNISEDDQRYLLSVEAPGFKNEQLSIDYHDDILTIKGKKESEEKCDKETYHLIERRMNQFERSFKIPGVEDQKIEASFDHGVLKILMPKKRQEKAKKIKIGQGKSFGIHAKDD